MRRESTRCGYVYLLAVFTIWGSLYVVSKYVLGKLPVFTISFVRFTLGFLTLSLAGRKAARGTAAQRTAFRETAGKGCGKYILFIGIAGYFLAVGAQLLGTKYAGASMASLINALNPITMTLFAAILLHERLTLKKAAGILLAVAGVYVILGKGGQVSIPGICPVSWDCCTWGLSVPGRLICCGIRVCPYWRRAPALLFIPSSPWSPPFWEFCSAGRIDGCTEWQLIRKVKLPLISSTITINVILNVIAGLKAFDYAFIMTNGGPGKSTKTLMFQIYEIAFTDQKMGRAGAFSVVSFIVIILITICMLYFLNKREVEL